ncbi:MAG: DUF3253 domain-containing protein [Bacteroidota bacterium]
MNIELYPEIRNLIRELLKQRGPNKSICPSEVARKLDTEHWRERMDEVRQVGKIMALEGEIIITQKTQMIDPKAGGKGAIRFRWPGPFQL